MKQTKIEQKIKETIEEGFVPYVMGWGDNISALEKPFGLDLFEIDVSKTENKEFFELYLIANGLAFGGKDMGMPKWVALDCVALPTASIGMALHVSKLPETLKEKFEFPSGYDGLVPISMYTGTPTFHDPKTLVNFTLCSIIENHGLAKYTMAMAIAAYDAHKIKSIIQYDSTAIKVHVKFGDLHIDSAQVAIHTLDTMTLVYSVDVKDKEKVFEEACDVPSVGEVKKKASFILDPYDENKKKEMQYNIENSEADYNILKPGMIDVDGKKLIPIVEKLL